MTEATVRLARANLPEADYMTTMKAATKSETATYQQVDNNSSEGVSGGSKNIFGASIGEFNDVTDTIVRYGTVIGWLYMGIALLYDDFYLKDPGKTKELVSDELPSKDMENLSQQITFTEIEVSVTKVTLRAGGGEGSGSESSEGVGSHDDKDGKDGGIGEGDAAGGGDGHVSGSEKEGARSHDNKDSKDGREKDAGRKAALDDGGMVPVRVVPAVTNYIKKSLERNAAKKAGINSE